MTIPRKRYVGVLCATGLLVGCAAASPASLESSSPAVISSKEVTQTVYFGNESDQKIHGAQYTQPFIPGFGWCPWTMDQGRPPALIPKAISGLHLSYRRPCIVQTESNTWSAGYGVDLNDSATICYWDAAYAKGQLRYTVMNGLQTKCTARWSAKKQAEFLLYYSR
jgi:hypothetical protein